MMQNNDEKSERWYGLKVYFGRCVDVNDRLTCMGYECYLPMHIARVTTADGRVVNKLKPLVGSLLFVRANSLALATISKELIGKASFYRNGRLGLPAPIRDEEMALFRLVTSTDIGRVDFLGDDDARWHVGDKVRVTSGPLTGAVGHVCRVKGNRRLVVSVDGICAIATAYVPSRCLEPVEPD